MDRVLVTGGTGFLGSNLARQLIDRKCRVRILRRPSSDLRAIGDLDVEHYRGDVLDPDSLAKAVQGCDTVFHTAALVTFLRRHADVQLDTNINGTRNVVHACLAAGVSRLVHTSSVAAIGHSEGTTLATEETPYDWGGTSGYKYSKHAAELEINKGIDAGLDAVIVNPSVIVGEGDVHWHGGHLLRVVKRGWTLAYVRGGMNVVYVGDVVDGEIKAAEKGRCGQRYILAGENLTHQEIFIRTAALIGGRAPLFELPLPVLRLAAMILETIGTATRTQPLVSRDLVAGAGRFNWFSSEKAIRELGYSISPFETAITRAYQWYRETGMM